ncbi:hypothetical protein LOTGIDRAFT_76338, partial [Lottia gigantea]
DKPGNIIIVDLLVEETTFSIINIYGPNNDNPTFFENIFKNINEFKTEKFIICGDFNLTLN